MECTKNYDYNLWVFISFMRNYTDLSDESITRIVKAILETSSTLIDDSIVMFYRTIIAEAECTGEHDNVFITSGFNDLKEKIK